ncbi:MAG: response regulator transcription factor [Muricoprocola sp.]
MKKILIVDDEPDIQQLIARYARREGYETVSAYDGTEAVQLCRETEFDVIIMDIMMEEMDGYTACRIIREEKDIPVIMLSAKGTEFDKLSGFDAGIDDYVIKPFSPKELMARIRVIIKRHEAAKEKNHPEKKICLGKLCIDESGRNVYVEEEKVELTAKEYELLIFLVKNTGIVLSRERILSEVWGYESVGEHRTVDWQIKLLRQKLGVCREYIVTIRGVGYKFEI